MNTRAGIARHRAEASSSLAVLAKAVSENAGGVGRQAAVIAAAGGLVLTSGVAANAAEASAQREASAPVALEAAAAAVQAPVSAEATSTLTFERPAVESVAAPVIEPPAPAPAPAPVVEAPQPAVQTSATAQVASSTPAAPVAATSGMGAAIASAAYAQLGVSQDCVSLVANSLAAVGIYYRDWPAGYLKIGRQVSAAEAQPGDLAYYADGGMGRAHIAVYVGNGQAVHGGWNGNQTTLFSVNVGTGPVFIRVGG